MSEPCSEERPAKAQSRNFPSLMLWSWEVEACTDLAICPSWAKDEGEWRLSHNAHHQGRKHTGDFSGNSKRVERAFKEMSLKPHLVYFLTFKAGNTHGFVCNCTQGYETNWVWYLEPVRRKKRTNSHKLSSNFHMCTAVQCTRAHRQMPTNK